MNFKQAQIESFCKNPNPDVKCVILFGSNEGTIAMLQKKCAEAICGDVQDAFRYASLEMSEISKEGQEIYRFQDISQCIFVESTPLVLIQK